MYNPFPELYHSEIFCAAAAADGVVRRVYLPGGVAPDMVVCVCVRELRELFHKLKTIEPVCAMNRMLPDDYDAGDPHMWMCECEWIELRITLILFKLPIILPALLYCFKSGLCEFVCVCVTS